MKFRLITIKDTFWLERPGRQMLLIAPDFPIPKGDWKNVTEKVMIVTPEGRNLEATAKFTIGHINYRDAHIPVAQRWRVFLHLTDAKKDDVPIGSKVFASPDIRDALQPREAV